MSQKAKPIKPKKSSFEKEQIFVRISTQIFLVIVIIVSVLIAFKNTFGDLDSTQDGASATALEFLSQPVNAEALISRPLNDLNKPALISKIESSNWNLLSNGEFDYDKYNSEQISAEHDLILTDEELGLIYSYLFVNHTDKYDIILYELTITIENDITYIKTVASIDFYKLFINKLGDTTNSNSSLPRRIYLSNQMIISGGEYTYNQAMINNLTKEQSAEVLNLIKSVNNSNLNSYIPSLVVSFATSLSNKTATTISYSNNQIAFTK